ncbi:MAG: MgtC/SapB family protein [Clostridia bacterium]|jgi:putative Mg2+ transporter-C (MgtC) family protein|nr:MgtC/SapB family protein [Clostridia bacterium]MBQ2256480.1 MgtC/SapB family protein [Clostridia bacterium]MBQ5792835.1 MgtC/SapB family protein [Clostridia bacterium]
MAWDLWLFEHIGAWDYLIRVIVACLCGGLIGLERTKRLKEAGIRTHIIVALGATLIMVVSKYGFSDVVGADASRIASNVITGVSFLGAGVIFVRGGSVKGLTTAAGIWATAAIGLALGAGMYTVGVLCTALMIILQIALHKFLPGDMQSSKELLLVISKDYHTVMPKIRQRLGEMKVLVSGVEMEKLENGDTRVTLDVRLHKDNVSDELLDLADEFPEIKSIVL